MKRRISMDLSGGGGGGGGDVVRVTAPLCGVMIALVAVAIPLWVRLRLSECNGIESGWVGVRNVCLECALAGSNRSKGCA